ncbi:undecaprenyl pyrophosphate phosphatase [Campylobacter subantarcticus LMG 24377]|uniref:Undecaprenyl-diphosphatase n=1 Tax=Campylobacter subantarcticus TaxID=497724 RepID=A0ABW9N408_9BACT|nr:undecaprenyl-diphosphate phosphatase [Campylobacter subantarcticus]AJC91604.1 undecaprenyl pyrophosphate phosphatase [Campylobacter subantarcticus LMG 24377]EAL3939115.1 undecaprenyl-diphosphate phosphatase [Campylobacter lari]MPB98951.1 undecaprenyl-diphosphate phosphatase [Campylobacter subantarcticus]
MNLDYYYALILGIIEGLTEFLPVSSTGHMILGAEILGLNIDDFWRSFFIIIQLGSILAVIFIFKDKLTQKLDIWLKLTVGFLPAGGVGFIAYKFLKEIFNGYTVAIMLIIGGIVFIIIELKHRKKDYMIHSLDEVSYKQAFVIGLTQALAIIPGTSRSGASIIGGLLLGLDRKVASEFSFLLAIPTMIIATAYSIYKEPQVLSNMSNFIPLAIGFVAAFVVAFVVIKIFLKLISKINFIPFGIYRIILGFVFLYLFMSGMLDISRTGV